MLPYIIEYPKIELKFNHSYTCEYQKTWQKNNAERMIKKNEKKKQHRTK